MASPLATFRKYDKILLAVFGVLLMFAFLIGDPLAMMSGGGGGGGGQPGTVVSYKGGAVTDIQLAVMHRADDLADELLRRIHSETLKKKETPRDFPEVPLQPMGKTERGLVYQVLLAEKAHKLGLSLSDADINQLLTQLSNESLDNDDIKRIRREVLADARGSRIQVTEKDLYSQLRIKILAQQMEALWRSEITSPAQMMPAMTLPPTEAWDYYRRTARQVRLEVMPLPVEKFIDEVKGSPSAAQKKEIFEKNKEMVATPLSPEPGLASPHRVAFGYVRIDFDKFLEEAKAAITEEDLRKEYDKRVEAGDFKTPILPDDRKDDEPKEDGEKEDSKKEDSEKKDDSTPPEDKKPAEKPQENKPEESKEDQTPADEKPAEQDDPSQPEDELTDDAEETDDAGPQPADEEKPADKSDEKPQPPDQDKPAADKPDAENPESEKPEAEKTDPEKTDDDKKPAAPKKPETRIKTFEEVRDDILSSLAQKPANDKQQEVFKALVEAIQGHKSKHREWKGLKEQAATEKKEFTEPEPELSAKLGPVLKKYDLKYTQLELMDRFEILRDEVGREFAESSMFLPGQFVPYPVTEVAYHPSIELFDPLQSGGEQRGVSFLYWKEAEEEAKPAEFDKVQDEIVRIWKMQKAYELAVEEAKALAAKAKDAESLHAAFPEGVDKAGAIQETNPVSWLTTGAMPFGMAPLEVSKIPQVPYAGEEFFQAVMDLQPGDVGYAPDRAHENVYVIRVISQTPEEDVLRNMFLARGIADPNIARQYSSTRSETFQTWLANLEKEMQVTWNRDPESFDR